MGAEEKRGGGGRERERVSKKEVSRDAKGERGFRKRATETGRVRGEREKGENLSPSTFRTIMSSPPWESQNLNYICL